MKFNTQSNEKRSSESDMPHGGSHPHSPSHWHPHAGIMCRGADDLAMGLALLTGCTYNSMYVGFDWDAANTQHIAQHQVRLEEAEQAIDDPHALSVPAYEVNGEMRFGLLGATVEDRILVVIYTWRGSLRRVVTAFPAAARQQRLYSERSP